VRTAVSLFCLFLLPPPACLFLTLIYNEASVITRF
jgi:hypothetical protein